MNVLGKDGLEKAEQRTTAMVGCPLDGLYLGSELSRNDVMQCVKGEMQFSSCVAILFADEDFGGVFQFHVGCVTG